jgi:hypothetical protein|tara:strand:- start:680 stop:907 length:228 start_codon:yes stop_codon:yes gene_type:complete
MDNAKLFRNKSGYLKWIENLDAADLQDFNIIELQGMIKELVGYQLERNPEEIIPWYINRKDLEGQILTTIRVLNK